MRPGRVEKKAKMKEKKKRNSQIWHFTYVPRPPTYRATPTKVVMWGGIRDLVNHAMCCQNWLRGLSPWRSKSAIFLCLYNKLGIPPNLWLLQIIANSAVKSTALIYQLTIAASGKHLWTDHYHRWVAYVPGRTYTAYFRYPTVPFFWFPFHTCSKQVHSVGTRQHFSFPLYKISPNSPWMSLYLFISTSFVLVVHHLLQTPSYITFRLSKPQQLYQPQSVSWLILTENSNNNPVDQK